MNKDGEALGRRLVALTESMPRRRAIPPQLERPPSKKRLAFSRKESLCVSPRALRRCG